MAVPMARPMPRATPCWARSKIECDPRGWVKRLQLRFVGERERLAGAADVDDSVRLSTHACRAVREACTGAYGSIARRGGKSESRIGLPRRPKCASKAL